MYTSLEDRTLILIINTLNMMHVGLVSHIVVTHPLFHVFMMSCSVNCKMCHLHLQVVTI